MASLRSASQSQKNKGRFSYELPRLGVFGDSSGEKGRQGGITKSGSRHARRLRVEAAWH